MLAAPGACGTRHGDRGSRPGPDELITAADQALDVFDFERLARAKLPPAHFGYLATGVDGDATLKANAAGFSNYSLRVRRLVGVARHRHVRESLRHDLGLAHRDGARRQPARVSSGRRTRDGPRGEIEEASPDPLDGLLHGVEDVNGRARRTVWYQLYPTDQWTVTQGARAPRRGGGLPGPRADGGPAGRLEPPDARARDPARFARLHGLPHEQPDAAQRLHHRQADVRRLDISGVTTSRRST